MVRFAPGRMTFNGRTPQQNEHAFGVRDQGLAYRPVEIVDFQTTEKRFAIFCRGMWFLKQA
jgi:hypothetical protein